MRIKQLVATLLNVYDIFICLVASIVDHNTIITPVEASPATLSVGPGMGLLLGLDAGCVQSWILDQQNVSKTHL